MAVIGAGEALGTSYGGPEVRTFAAKSNWLAAGDSRLDAQSYAGGSQQTLDDLQGSGWPLDRVGSLCGTMWHPVQNQARSNFKRIYTEKAFGVPFVSSRSMFSFPLKTEKYLSRLMPKLPDLMVPEGWIVVSRSGTVGNVLYIGHSLAHCAISDHAIRIEPVDVPAGYLSAFLSSSYGQRLMAGNVFGATVEELEPKHIASIPLPRLGDLEGEVHQLMTRASKIRDRANDVAENVESDLYEILGVSEFNDEDVEYIGRTPGGPRAFEIAWQEVGNRLDATNHVPIVRSAVKKLAEGRYPLVSLHDVVSRIYVAPRFARNYVAEEHGIPFLQGSQLPLIRPFNLQYLSRSLTKHIERWVIKSGWVLVTCSGTIGRISISSAKQDGWTASQHILRITPDLAEYHPGFLWAFLGTEYGQHQLRSKIYGGVVDELTEVDMGMVRVPKVPVADQTALGERVLRMYEDRDEAAALEDDAIARVEAAVAAGPGMAPNGAQPARA